MRLWGRRSAARPTGPVTMTVGAQSEDAPLPPPPVDPVPGLRRIVAEALILQDQADEVVRGAHARMHLRPLAVKGGPLVHRFFCLRDDLPDPGTDVMAQRISDEVSAVLHHHAMTVATVLDLVANEWRSERLARQLDAIDGLGEPARTLERVYAELTGRPVAGPTVVWSEAG